MGERLAQLVAEEQDGSLTVLEVASKMHVSITLAQEFLKVHTSYISHMCDRTFILRFGPDIFSALFFLQTGEAGGHLCRDESIHGLLFYPNCFPELVKALEQSAGGS